MEPVRSDPPRWRGPEKDGVPGQVADDFRVRLERLTAIVGSLAEGLVLVGGDGQILEWNPAAERLLGMDADQLAGRTSTDPRWRAVHPDGTPWPGEEQPAMECLRTGEAIQGAVMGIHRPDDTLVWLEVGAQLTVSAEGERLCQTVFTDVTEQRTLEEALRASERASTLALDALEQGVVLVDSSATIIRSNPATTRIVGYTPEELTARWRDGTWETFDEHWRPIPPEDRILFRALAGEVVEEEIVGWLCKDGDGVLLRVSCVPDADGAGGVLVAFTDVTHELELLHDLARFRHLFQNANDIITVVDEAGRRLYTSPSHQRILGYPEGWRHPDGMLGLIHPDDVEVTALELAELAAGRRGPEPFTARVQAMSGEWRTMEFVGVNLLHEPTVRGVVLTWRDTTERELLSAELAHLASHDPLTGLPNRSVFEPELEEALARTRRHPAHVGLCFIDLDGFKRVNDTHGHAAGDAVLVEVADRIRLVTRSGDTAARMGGDEFVVILDAISSLDQAAKAARRIRNAIVTPPITIGNLTVGASFGVALNEPGESPASLLVRADAALYRAKATRDSSVEVASEPHLVITQR